MSVTHYAKVVSKYVNYYISNYHLTQDRYTGIDQSVASHLRKNESFEVITKNQHDKITGKAPKDEPKTKEE